MKIIDAIPIAKGIPQEKLSYFTSKDVSVGALVSIPVRNKEVPAIVSAVYDAKELKSSLKGSDFSIKPIKSIISPCLITPEFMDACKEIAEYYIVARGSIIKDFIPQAILENRSEQKLILPSPSAKQDGRHETSIIQSSGENRLHHYKSIVREELAKNKSVFICVPTTAETENIFSELSRGIEKYVFVFSSKMSKKKIIDLWKKVLEEKHPVLIICTKSFLSIPRRDIGAIIVEQESSSAYKNQKKPYMDARVSIEIISRKIKSKLIFGDELLRTETFYRQEIGEFSPTSVLQSRMTSNAEQTIIDAKKYFEEKKVAGKKLISTPELIQIIGDCVSKKEKIIIFAHRKGYSPTTICGDCHRTILCEKCSAPVVTIKADSKNNQVCHKCLAELPAPDRCPYCKSWRLESYGIGAQAVMEEIKKLFPETKIFEMNSDSVASDKEGKKMADEFHLNGGIIVGTELIFSYIKQPVDNIAVISIDGLFALPEFKMNEKIFRLLLRLKSLAKKTFAIQTRFPEMPVFDNVLRGNISGFYKKEIEERKLFQYPPFKLLIKITRENKNETLLNSEIETMQKVLAEWNPKTYSAFIPKVKNFYIKHILLKIDPSLWSPNKKGQPLNQEKLYRVLSSLDPSWKIDINPESLL